MHYTGTVDIIGKLLSWKLSIILLGYILYGDQIGRSNIFRTELELIRNGFGTRTCGPRRPAGCQVTEMKFLLTHH